MNLYGRLVSVEGTVVTYRIGFDYKDITGAVQYDYAIGEYKAISEPVMGIIYKNALDSLLRKNRKSFLEGVFPEKISREIG